MNLKSKYKGISFFRYSEFAEDGVVKYGWVESEDVDMPCVVAYASQSKKVSDQDKATAKSMGATASSLEDYSMFFLRMVGYSALEFIDKWEGGEKYFHVHWNSLDKPLDSAFVFSLAFLIHQGKKFTHAGRIYKLLNEA